MHVTLRPLFAVLLTSPLFIAHTASAQGVMKAPEGFTNLVGEDLTGWWGAKTENPAKYMAMSKEALKEKIDKSLPNIGKFRTCIDVLLYEVGGYSLPHINRFAFANVFSFPGSIT